MDGMLLTIGTLITLGGLISIFLSWGEEKSHSHYTINHIEQLKAEETTVPDTPLAEELHPIQKKDPGDNRESTMNMREVMIPGGQPQDVKPALTLFTQKDDQSNL